VSTAKMATTKATMMARFMKALFRAGGFLDPKR
jgi:hypothetical protein